MLEGAPVVLVAVIGPGLPAHASAWAYSSSGRELAEIIASVT
ncbi:hypothetical protein [Actinomadura sp. KC345]|nr:hypothetical protein [Actinomadura sp. KC345]